MSRELFSLTFEKVRHAPNYTLFELKHDEDMLSIYTEKRTGETLETLLKSPPPKRPLTHDLIQLLLGGLDAKMVHVIIDRLDNTTYHSKLILEKGCDTQREVLEIDCRPSDSITLALMNQLPIYTTRQVLDASKTHTVE